MTATEELRAKLTRRGVEWKAPTSFDGTARYDTTAGGYWFHEFDGKITIHGLTPEQAIAATLGRGTCHITPKFTCSECGHQYPTRNYESYETCDGRTAFAPLGYNVLACKKPNYCPNCGAKVVAASESVEHHGGA